MSKLSKQKGDKAQNEPASKDEAATAQEKPEESPAKMPADNVDMVEAAEESVAGGDAPLLRAKQSQA